MDKQDNTDETKEHEIKVVVVGESKVGKTCLILGYTSHAFPFGYVPTIAQGNTARFTHKEGPVTMTMWDMSAGNIHFPRIRPLSYDCTDTFILGFSVVDRESFENVKKIWIPELNRYSPGVPIILVAMKSDLHLNNVTLEQQPKESVTPISYAEGLQLSKEINAVKYLECSSLTQEGLNNVFLVALQTSMHNQKFIKYRRRRGRFCSVL